MHLAKANPEASGDPFLTLMGPHRDEMWPAALGIHEQAVAYNCKTGDLEVGPANLATEEMDAWKNSRAPECVVGTCDWWGQLPTGVPWVDDLKTGWRKPEVTTPQMLFYGMCRAKVAKAPTCYLSITHYPRAADAPTREDLWRQAGPVTLEAFELDLRRAWARTLLGPLASPGSHCGYCPSKSVCPGANA